MRTITLRVNISQLSLEPTRIAFYHPWRGSDVYWLVPIQFVVRLKYRPNGKVDVVIWQAYLGQEAADVA